MMKQEQNDRFVATPGQYLTRRMQGRAGPRFAKKAHVLRSYEELMASRTVDSLFETQSLLQSNQCLLDARHVVACIEMADVIAFPCVRATPPHLDRCSGHIGR
jgi:hypothetical protein